MLGPILDQIGDLELAARFPGIRVPVGAKMQIRSSPRWKTIGIDLLTALETAVEMSEQNVVIEAVTLRKLREFAAETRRIRKQPSQ